MYLRSPITSDGRFFRNIEMRRAGAVRALGITRAAMWRKIRMSLNVKFKFFI